MSGRSLFASTIHDNTYMSECEKFGMAWGCKEDCPVLEKGNCQNWTSVEEFLKEED